MPRPSKGPRLYLRRARPSLGRKAVWLIRDGQHDFATGCVGSPAEPGPPEGAQRALADYIVNKYRPTRKARDIEQIDIADVLSIYLDDCGDDQAGRKKLEGRISRLNSFWGGRILSDVSTATCKEYVKVRGNTGGARLSSESGKIVPHTLRHTAATWLMQRGVSIWQAAGYLGMSAEILDRVYGHHSPDHLKGAADAITGKNKERVSVVVSVVGESEARPRLQKSK